MAVPGPTSWESFNFSDDVLEKIKAAKYETPTQIQQQAIPSILDGKDIIAMARTGSGKTAAFLLPLIEKLSKSRKIPSSSSPGSSVRALIVSPTRELALQTLKFAQQFSDELNFKTVVGGELMATQFAALHSSNTDVIIAVPGRLMHIFTEMSLNSLPNIEYLVFDEADRLFEQNFQVQLTEILARCTCEHRQTLLFSATMPPKVGEFASAGLHDPKLIRLDAELKLNEKLKLSNIFCRTEEKYSILSYIFRHIFDTESEQTILFTATKYHVEFISKLLNELSIPNSYLYSSLNQGQRIKNMEDFRSGNSRVLVCTDLAARGVDIPELDNVLHFHFPSNGKTFIHRCGRTCRAGSSKGTSLSVLSPDEVPYAVEVMTYVEKEEVLDNGVFQIPHDEINVFTDIVNKKCNSNGDLEYWKIYYY